MPLPTFVRLPGPEIVPEADELVAWFTTTPPSPIDIVAAASSVSEPIAGAERKRALGSGVLAPPGACSQAVRP